MSTMTVLFPQRVSDLQLKALNQTSRHLQSGHRSSVKHQEAILLGNTPTPVT